MLLLQHLFFGRRIATFKWEESGFWLSISLLWSLWRLFYLIGLKEASFAVFCAFLSASFLGYGLVTKYDANTENMLLGFAVFFGIGVLGLQDSMFSINTYSVLFLSVFLFWAFLYQKSSQSHVVYNNERKYSSVATMDFYMTIGSIPLLVMIYWWGGAHAKYSLTGIFVHFLELTNLEKMILLLITISEQLTNFLADRILQGF